MKSSRPTWLLTGLLILLASAPAGAGARQVGLQLPGKPKVPFAKGDTLLIAPFLTVTDLTDEANPEAKRAEEELQNFLMKLLTKSEEFRVEAGRGTPLPSSNIETLQGAGSFWKTLASQYGARYVVSGVLDFRISDQSGYETEEYVSPTTGRTYYRQVMKERTGVSLELLLWVYSAEDGGLLDERRFKHFLEKRGSTMDFVNAFFEGMHAFEDELRGVFLPRKVAQKRWFYEF
jgi:hypothetical protein